jgi:hypothetical protein
MTLNALDAEPGMEALIAAGEVGYEQRDGLAECSLLLRSQLVPVAPE